jgi:hypothetical protein
VGSLHTPPSSAAAEIAALGPALGWAAAEFGPDLLLLGDYDLRPPTPYRTRARKRAAGGARAGSRGRGLLQSDGSYFPRGGGG